jgi:hypothetical protein
LILAAHLSVHVLEQVAQVTGDGEYDPTAASSGAPMDVETVVELSDDGDGLNGFATPQRPVLHEWPSEGGEPVTVAADMLEVLAEGDGSDPVTPNAKAKAKSTASPQRPAGVPKSMAKAKSMAKGKAKSKATGGAKSTADGGAKSMAKQKAKPKPKNENVRRDKAKAVPKAAPASEIVPKSKAKAIPKAAPASEIVPKSKAHAKSAVAVAESVPKAVQKAKAKSTASPATDLVPKAVSKVASKAVSKPKAKAAPAPDGGDDDGDKEDDEASDAEGEEEDDVEGEEENTDEIEAGVVVVAQGQEPLVPAGTANDWSGLFEGRVRCDSCGRFVLYKRCRLIRKADALWRCGSCGVKHVQLRRAYGTWPTADFQRLSEAH